MAEKLIDEVTIKLSPKLKRQLAALAEAEGTSASELIRHLITHHVEEKERHYLAMHTIFAKPEA